MNNYRNKFESDTAVALDSAKVKFAYEKDKIPYTVSGKYLADFTVQTRTGKTIYIETKGNGRSFDAHTKRKMIAVKTQHPELDIKILFYSNGKCGPKRKDGTFMRQLDWAKKYGFDAAVGEIPVEWME